MSRVDAVGLATWQKSEARAGNRLSVTCFQSGGLGLDRGEAAVVAGVTHFALQHVQQQYRALIAIRLLVDGFESLEGAIVD